MTFDLYRTIYIFANTFCIEIIRRSMHLFFDHPYYGRKICVLTYLLYFVMTSGTYLLWDTPFICLAANLFTIGLIAFQYHGNFQKKILATAFTYISFFISEIIVGVITNYFSFPIFAEADYHNAVGLMIAKLLNFMLILIARKFQFLNTNRSVSTFDWIATICIPIGTISLEIMLIHAKSTSKWAVFVSVMIVFLLNGFIFYLYDKMEESYQQKLESVEIEQERTIYYHQCMAMMESEQNLRQFKHNINNQLEMIQILIEKGNMDELKKQLNDILQEKEKMEHICTTGNVVVDGILNYKLGILKQADVEIRTELEIPKQIFMNTKDLTLLFGNLLDNMIDALIPMQTNKICSIRMKFSKNRLFLHFANTYEKEVVCVHGKIISSKPDEKEHGIGLQSVQEVVDKYHGYMDIHYGSQIFSINVILILPLEDEENKLNDKSYCNSQPPIQRCA